MSPGSGLDRDLSAPPAARPPPLPISHVPFPDRASAPYPPILCIQDQEAEALARPEEWILGLVASLPFTSDRAPCCGRASGLSAMAGGGAGEEGNLEEFFKYRKRTRGASTASGDGLDLGGIRGYTAASSASAAPPHRPPASSQVLLLLSVLQFSRENVGTAIVKIKDGGTE
ncbi:hypothetical protein EJB05_33083 [Eragrostis curvula]|uniref:Uncharacterized protein n=1 Tax=Eragrostis curvula TaxID=38414 RepID=A0A5J9U210_9POAL|nr:hypothetical protein EJB05_33083 [Eragrostis curvula]